MGEIFERLLPDTPFEWTGERLTTGTSGQVEIEHLHRYFLARNLCRGLDVLDVAAGEGYGTALIAQVARSVVGVEISAAAVAYATQAYRGTNIRFVEGDARRLPVGDASMDAVVSFETIEHFYEHEQFLAEVRRVLRPDGLFIVSSPERDTYSPSGSAANPYHVRELSRGEFSTLLYGTFAHVRLLGQRPILGSLLASEGDGTDGTLTFERRGPRHFEASVGLPRPVYYVAIASNQPLIGIPASVYIETAEIGTVLAAADAAASMAAELPPLQERAVAAEAAHGAARNELALSIQQADEQAESFRAQLRAAEAAHLAARRELALCIEQAHEQAASIREEMRVAEVAHLAACNELALDVRQAKEQLRVATELSQDHAARADAIEERMAVQLAEMRAEVVTAQGGAEFARAEAAAAAVQRDIARVAARRAAAAAERHWHGRLLELEQRASGAEEHARAADELARAAGQRAEEMREHVRVADEQAAEWRRQYEGLRARLEAFLRRFGILFAARLVPGLLRRFVRRRLLRWGR